MPAQVIGDLSVRVSANVRKFNTGIRMAAAKLASLSGMARTVAASASVASKSLTLMAASMRKVAAVSFAGLSKGITAAANGVQGLGRAAKRMGTIGTIAFAGMTYVGGTFEKQMNIIKGVMVGAGNYTAEALDRMRAKAKDLGATTKFTAKEAADGMELLTRAGFNADKTIGAMSTVLAGAQANNIALADSADIVARIYGPLAKKVKDAGEVMDIVTVASAQANTNIMEMKEAFKFVAPAITTAKTSVKEAAAALDVLAESGLKGGMAGTGLRRMFSALYKASPALTKALKKYGLEVADLDPKTNSLTEIIQKMEKAGLDSATAFELFGERGGPAVKALLDKGSVAIKKYQAGLQGIEGRTISMQKEMDKGLFPALHILKSAMQALSIEVFETYSQKLSNIIRRTAAWIGAVAKSVRTSETFRTMVNKIWVAVSSLARGIIDMVGAIGIDLFGPAKESGSAFVEGVTQLGLKLQDLAKNKEVISSITSTIRGIGSAAMWVGKKIYEGIIIGIQLIKAAIPTVQVAFWSMATQVAEAINWIWQQMASFKGRMIGMFKVVSGTAQQMFWKMSAAITTSLNNALNFFIKKAQQTIYALRLEKVIKVRKVDFLGDSSKIAKIQAKKAGETINEGLRQIIETKAPDLIPQSKIDDMRNKVKGITPLMQQEIGNLWKKVSDVGKGQPFGAGIAKEAGSRMKAASVEAKKAVAPKEAKTGGEAVVEDRNVVPQLLSQVKLLRELLGKSRTMKEETYKGFLDLIDQQKQYINTEAERKALGAIQVRLRQFEVEGSGQTSLSERRAYWSG